MTRRTHLFPTHTTSRRVRRTGLALAVLFSVVLLSGCSRDQDGGATSGAVQPDVGQADRDGSGGDEAVAGGAPEIAPDKGGEELPQDAPPGGTNLTEQIVRTGDVSVDVDDITSAANRITAVVNSAGGAIGSDQRQGDPADGTADLVLRIPPDSFDDVLETVSALGEELSRSVSAQDVSTAVADIDARVQSLQNSVDRLLALAAQAVSVSDLITVESELTYRQAELESLQAQQRALADQVSLATLTVRLAASSEADSTDTGFTASLAAGWDALLTFGAGLISIIGVLLPWLALVILIGIPLWLLVRRRSATSRAAAAASVPPTASFGPAAADGPPAGQPVSAQATSEPTRPPE